MATIIGNNAQLSHTAQQLDDAIESENTQVLSSVSAITSVTPPADSEITVTGVGRYAWVSGDTTSADGVIVVESGVAAYAPGGSSEGRWHLQYDGAVNFKFWSPDKTGATDVSSKLQAAIDVARGEVVISEPGDYRIDTGIEVPNDVQLRMLSGTMLVYYGSGVGLLFEGGASESTVHEHHIRIKRNTVEWFNGGGDTTSVGVKIRNVDWNHFYLHGVENFYKGVEILGDDNGSTANSLYLGRIRNNKKGLVFSSLNSGWANQNFVCGGAIRIDNAYASPVETGSRLIEVVETGNNSTFMNINLEGGSPELNVEVGVPYFSFIDCRYEQIGTGGFKITSNGRYGRIIGGYSNWGPDSDIFDNDGDEIQIIGTRGASFYGDSNAGSPFGGACVKMYPLSSNLSLADIIFNQDGTIRAERNGVGDLYVYGSNGKYDATLNPSGDAYAKTIVKSDGTIRVGDGTFDPNPIVQDRKIIFHNSSGTEKHRVEYDEPNDRLEITGAGGVVFYIDGSTGFIGMGAVPDGTNTVRVGGLVRIEGNTQLDSNLTLPSMPTSDPAVAGRLWNDSGTVKISAG